MSNVNQDTHLCLLHKSLLTSWGTACLFSPAVARVHPCWAHFSNSSFIIWVVVLLLSLSGALCNCFKACLWHFGYVLSVTRPSLHPWRQPRPIYILVNQARGPEEKGMQMCVCLGPVGAHIRVSQSGRAVQQLGHRLCLERRVSWGLQLSASYSSLQVLLWSSCERQTALMWYEM